MKPLTGLRCVDRHTQQLGNTCAQLRLSGYEPVTDMLHTGSRYLRFSAQFTDRSEMVGYADLGAWLATTLPELEGIDWVSIDDALLPGLIDSASWQPDLVSQHAPVAACTVSPIFGHPDQVAQLPRIRSQHGWILVEQFQPTNSDGLVGVQPLAGVSIPLKFQLGQSEFPLQRLSMIELGDVLVIATPRLRVVSKGKTLFTFAVHQESIMILESEQGMDAEFPEFEAYQSDVNPELTDNTGKPLSPAKLATLPVHLSFVLMEKSVTLAELQSMVPQQIVALPSEQFRGVDIRVNGQSFARGELVQFADGQLGVEIQRIWN